MLVGSRFAYVLMPRTGSTRISQILIELTDARQVGRKHDRLTVKPEGKRLFGSVRNPWAWYVSLWAWRAQGQNPVSPLLYKDDARWGHYYDQDDPVLFQSWLRAVHNPDNAGLLPWNYGDYEFREEVGFMTYRYRYLYPGGIVDDWVRLEDMALTLGAALAAAGVPVPMGLLADMCRVRHNATDHGPYLDYYDRETFELVRDREQLIVTNHGYNGNFQDTGGDLRLPQ